MHKLRGRQGQKLICYKMNNLQRLWNSKTYRDLLSKQNCRLVIRKMFSAPRLIRPCRHDKSQVWRSVCITKSEVLISHDPNLLFWFWGEHKSHSERKTKTQPTWSRQRLCSDVQQPWTPFSKKTPKLSSTHQQTHLVINLYSRCNYWWKAIKLFYFRGFHSKVNPTTSQVTAASALRVHKPESVFHFPKAHRTVRLSEAQGRLPLYLAWTDSN